MVIRDCRFPLAALSLLMAMSATGAAQIIGFELVAASSSWMAQPHDIVLSADGARLYVADNNNHRIVVLNAETLVETGVFGAGEVSAPHDVVFDAQGRLLVADTGNSRIAVYAVDGNGGTLVATVSGGVRRPEGVDLHPDGRILATGAASGNLVAFRDGEVVAERGGFSSPHDVVVDADGNLWVADAGNDRVVKLSSDFQPMMVLSGEAYGFNGPRYLDFDADGRLYVADKYTHTIKIIAPDGELIQVLGSGQAGEGPGLFDRPEGVEIRGRDVWVSDTYNDRIVRYRMSDQPQS